MRRQSIFAMRCAGAGEDKRREFTVQLAESSSEVCCAAHPPHVPFSVASKPDLTRRRGEIVPCHHQFPFSPPLTAVCLPPPRQPPWDGSLFRDGTFRNIKPTCLHMLPARISSLAVWFKLVSPSVRQNSWTQRKGSRFNLIFFNRFTCGCHGNRWTTERVNTGETLYPLGTTYGQERFQCTWMAFTPWIKRSGVISWPEYELLLLILGRS